MCVRPFATYSLRKQARAAQADDQLTCKEFIAVLWRQALSGREADEPSGEIERHPARWYGYPQSAGDAKFLVRMRLSCGSLEGA